MTNENEQFAGTKRRTVAALIGIVEIAQSNANEAKTLL